MRSKSFKLVFALIVVLAFILIGYSVFAVQNHKHRQRAFATSRRNNYQADWCERQGHRRRIPAGVGVQNVHHHKSTGTAGCQRRHGCRH